MQTHTERPARAAGATFRQLAAQERKAAKTRKRVRELRQIASAEIERLIAFMDETDGYTTTELEEAVDDRGCCDNELEKNLSGIHAHHIPDASGDQFGDLEDDLEGEPSLGSLSSSGGSQTEWCRGDGFDLEDSGLGNDDREDTNEDGDGEPDREPSLGWTEEQSIAGIVPPSDGMDREIGDCKASVLAARARGKSPNPGMQVHNYGYMKRISGLTDWQKTILGAEWIGS